MPIEEILLGRLQSNVKPGALAQVPLVLVDGAPKMVALLGQVP